MIIVFILTILRFFSQQEPSQPLSPYSLIAKHFIYIKNGIVLNR